MNIELREDKLLCHGFTCRSKKDPSGGGEGRNALSTRNAFSRAGGAKGRLNA